PAPRRSTRTSRYGPSKLSRMRFQTAPERPSPCTSTTGIPSPVTSTCRSAPVTATSGKGLHGLDDLLDARRVRRLERGRERNRRGRRGDAPDGGVQRVERLLGDDRGDLRRNAALRRALVDHDERTRLLDRRDDRLDVERRERARIDYLNARP